MNLYRNNYLVFLIIMTDQCPVIIRWHKWHVINLLYHASCIYAVYHHTCTYIYMFIILMCMIIIICAMIEVSVCVQWLTSGTISSCQWDLWPAISNQYYNMEIAHCLRCSQSNRVRTKFIMNEWIRMPALMPVWFTHITFDCREII